MTDNELTVTTACIQALSALPNPEEKIKLLLSGLFDSVQKQKTNFSTHENVTASSVSSKIIFTKQEISNMAKTFKSDFVANGFAAHILKRQNSKNSVIFEIRYRRNGYYIHVSGATLEKAKENFIRETLPENIEKHKRIEKTTSLNTFLFVTQEWLKFRKTNLNPVTLKNYESYCKRFLFPSLGGRPISSIKTIDISNIMATVQGRVYEDLRVVLNSVFKYALANSLISNNPMLLIPFKKAERNSRRALTTEELKRLIHRLNLSEFKDYKQTFLILLFFGLRPCELEDARFEEDFLIARNAKRKAGKIEYKKIPICNQARELLDLSAPIKALHRTDVLNRIFKRIMNDDTVTQYYLRHTFATVCQQYVRPDIVDIWMGDSSERLVGRVYTHFSDDFMLKQMQNVVFDF